MTVLAVTITLDQENPIQLSGDDYMISGTFTYDTGDYVAGGNIVSATGAQCLANFRLNSVTRLITDGGSIGNHRHVWLKSTGAVKTFHKLTGDFLPVEHAASAMTAQTIGFIAFGKKAA
jgi:hypothetical protein